jgi:hypothetical protein
MALQGINMPMMPVGMEALLTATFSSLGLQRSQLEDFFPGPAFLAWVSIAGSSTPVTHLSHVCVGLDTWMAENLAGNGMPTGLRIDIPLSSSA